MRDVLQPQVGLRIDQRAAGQADRAAELRRGERAVGGGGDAQEARRLRRALRQRDVGHRQRHRAAQPHVEPRPGERNPSRALHVEPVRPGGVRPAELDRPPVVAAGGGEPERPDAVVGEDPRRKPLAAQVEAGRGIGARAGDVRPSGQRAAQAAVARHPVDQRQRKRLQLDREVEVARPERHLAPRRGGEALSRPDAGGEVEDLVRGLAAGVERHRRQPGAPGHRRAHRRGGEVEAHVRGAARADDPGGAVDGASEPEVGPDGVGDAERQVADRHVDVDAPPPPGPGR